MTILPCDFSPSKVGPKVPPSLRPRLLRVGDPHLLRRRLQVQRRGERAGRVTRYFYIIPARNLVEFVHKLVTLFLGLGSESVCQKTRRGHR